MASRPLSSHGSWTVFHIGTNDRWVVCDDDDEILRLSDDAESGDAS